MAESEEELKSLLMKVKVESEKVGLELNIQKMKIMASGPITSWETDGETVETVSDFIFWASKSLQMVTAAMKLKDAYSWKESYDQPRSLDSIFKSRDITLPTKVCLVEVYGFSCGHVWMWRVGLSTKELMLLNCGVGEDSWESIGRQGDPTSPF